MDRERDLILSGRPPTLCWEGVALGWKEEFPRPRSRGGDIPPPPLSAGWKTDPATPDFSDIPTTPTISSVKSDSALNSMEYWDYSVELECLSGPEDLQLAAELGKTLLERNKELENSLKHQQAIIDDQAQEIEYLTKQTAALREVNDSRLRIYEQLEISITELEKNNIRLNEESISDKSRIKSLSTTVDLLEGRCEELQRCVDEARSQERIRKRREKRRTSQKEDAASRKASGQDTVCQDEAHIEAMFSEEEVARLSGEVAWLKEETRHGDRKVVELEEQVKSLVAENSQLSAGLEAARRQSERCRPTRSSTVEEEVLALEEVSEGILCKKCLGLTEDSSSSQNQNAIELVQMGASELITQAINSVTTWTKEDTAEPKDQNNLIFLQSSIQDVETSLSANNHEDLVSKLDDQYRHLIDKYEALLSLHNQSSSERYHSEASISHQISLQEELRMSGQFENSDDENQESTTNHASIAQIENGELQIIRQDQFGFSEPSHMLNSNKPFCGRLTSSSMSKAEEYSEAETYSSGFSEGIDFKYCNKQTQTDVVIECQAKPSNEFKDYKKDENPLDLNKDANYMDDHFQTTPKYKIIFKEIFQVLKQAQVDTEGYQEEKQEQNKSKLSKPFSVNEKPAHKESMNYNVWKKKTKICNKDKGFEWDSNEYPSLASASVARLKILEESYANVLRKGIKQNYN